MIKVYCASKSKHHLWWATLRAAGIPITATWVDWDHNENPNGEPSNDAWRKHWSGCIEQARDCDILLVYCGPEENQNGAFLEIGSALGAGKTVYLVTEHEWSWQHHPNVRRFVSLLLGVLKASTTSEERLDIQHNRIRRRCAGACAA
jgi:Nucleoside 2-deoxyribosyltransferase